MQLRTSEAAGLQQLLEKTWAYGRKGVVANAIVCLFDYFDNV